MMLEQRDRYYREEEGQEEIVIQVPGISGPPLTARFVLVLTPEGRVLVRVLEKERIRVRERVRVRQGLNVAR